jgi:hypothetical protein
VPFGEIARQWFAAAIMGIFVQIGIWFESTYINFSYNIVTVMILVGLGATVYFSTLFALSSRFRTTIVNNLPTQFKPSFLKK